MKKVMMMCFSLVMVFGLVACGSEEKAKEYKKGDTITVLTNSGYDPYEMVDAKGNLYGFDIDVMEEAAKIAGYKVEWKDIDFDAIVDSVKMDKGDIGMAGITYTEERAKKVGFSDVYYAGEDAQNYVLVKDDSAMNTTEDIKGKKIGTQMGTIQESVLISLEKEYDLTLDKRKNYADLVLELKKGVVDAVVVEKAIAVEQAEKQGGLKYYKLEAGAELAGNAMIFKKDSALTEDFNKAIQEMIDNGAMDTLVQKYFAK